MAVMKQVTTGWLVEMAEHFKAHPEIIVNGFVRSGIPSALESLDENETDGERSETDEESSEIETDGEYGDSQTEYKGEQDQKPIYLD